MTDLATLGLEVRSAQVEKGASSLEKLSGAAKRAEAASEGLSSTSTRNAAAIAREGSAATKAAAQVEQLSRMAQRHTAVVSGSITPVGNLAAQFQDIGVSAAMAMNPLQIALAQGTQISAVFGGMGASGAIKSLGAAFASIISPVSIATIGIVALVAAGIQMVNWGHAAAFALNELADVVQVIGPYAVAAAGALALMYAPAILGGITVLSETILGLTARLAGMAIGFAASWAAALGPFGLIIAGIGLVASAVYVFRDQVSQAIGVDVVGVVKDAVNGIIGAFVGAFDGIKDTWSKLPAALGDLVYQSANWVIKGVEAMVQNVIDGLNKLINKYALWRAKIGHPLSPETYNNMTLGPVDFGGLTNRFKGAAVDTASTMAADIKAAQGKDYLGQISSGVSNMVSGAVSALHDLAGEALKLGQGKTKKHHKTEAEHMAERYDRITQSGENYIAMQEVEQKTLGMTDLQAAKLVHTQELLNRAKQAGIDLTPTQVAALTKLGSAMGAAEIATKKAREAFQDAKDMTKGFLSDFTSAIEQGKSLWQAFGDAASNVLDKIISKIEDNLVDALFSAKNASGGGGGGWLSNIISGIGSLFGGGSDPWAGLRVASANGNIFSGPGIAAYANSVVTRPTVFPFAHGAGLMGEAGPEAIMPLRRGPDGRLGVTAHGGGQAAYNDNRVYQIDARGAQKGVGEEIKRALAEYDAEVAPHTARRAVNESYSAGNDLGQL